MAAVNMHYVNVGYFRVDANGNLVNKDDPNTTINAVLQGGHDHLVIPDSNVPNSSNYPTIKAFLSLEAASGFKLYYMDQTKIVTYDS